VLASGEAGEASLSDEAACGVSVVVRGSVTAPTVKRAKETAIAMAPALRLAGSHAHERRPVTKT
jgi:hypothetical protein